MNKVPQVSIIIPNYNHAIFLEKRLYSVFNQTFQDFEVILLDDASTDDSLEILEQYRDHPKVSHFISNQRNSGSPFKQWKRGVNLAVGKYIWIAESDDYCRLDFLEKIFDFIQASVQELGLVYTQSIDIRNDGNLIGDRISWTSEFKPNIWENNFVISGNKFIKKYLKVKNVIPNASAVVFKKSLVGNQTFSKKIVEMTMCGDWLFWLSILPNSNLGFVHESLNYFREHESVSRKHFSRKKKIARLLEEGFIRKKLQRLNIQQGFEVRKLYLKWYNLHKLKDLANLNFYKILIKKSDSINFLEIFLKNKLNAGKRCT